MQLAEAAAKDEAAFSMRVLRHLASSSSRANLAVSPLSIHAALALLAAGARGGTLDEIAGFLGPAGGSAHAALASYVALRVFADDAGGEGGTGTGTVTTARFANAVWVDADLQLKPAFARVAAELYRAEARQASFKTMPEEARSQMNQWVASATAGRIKDLLPPGSVHRGTPAVLTNALYFKGAWDRKFDACLTRDEAFFLHGGGCVRVPFMSSTGKQRVACRPGYKVLRLRYAAQQHGGGGERRMFSMYIYLPDARDGLPALLRALSAGEDPAAALESCGTLADEVPVRAFGVPRFAVACKTSARELLRGLGLHLPFDRAAADLGDMVEAAPEPLVVSDVYHESFVEANEEGTEAAAATAVAVGFGSARAEAPPPPVDFVANHPFLFLIREELSGVVVFAGQVIDPSISQSQ